MLKRFVLSMCFVGLTALSAQARDRVGLDINIGGGDPPPPPPVAVQTGHYETRTETVLVEPEHRERQYVPRVTETRHDIYGRTYTLLVREAYYQEVIVPARYETRQVQVYVPEVVYVQPPPPPPRRSLLDVFLKVK